MKPMINLIKKNLTYITLVLMLLWGVGMAFAMPPIWAAASFCTLVVPTVNAVMGKKYAIPMAVVGFAWLVIAIIMNM